MNHKIPTLKTQIRWIIIFFMAALIFSGATAIPAETELTIILQHISADSTIGRLLTVVLHAVQVTGANYPFLFYGNDWLAFAHFVIAITFIGVLKDPVKNIWVLEFGMIACIMVIPFALIAGGMRGLPIWWRLIDCSFGVIGFIPLWICRRKTLQLQQFAKEDRLNIIF
jgi:hypothetical protein